MMSEAELLGFAKRGLYDYEQGLVESLANAPYGERATLAKLLIKTHEQIDWVREEIRKVTDGEDDDW